MLVWICVVSIRACPSRAHLLEVVLLLEHLHRHAVPKIGIQEIPTIDILLQVLGWTNERKSRLVRSGASVDQRAG